MITAALDARRAGARAPLTEQFLQQAAPAYLTSRQQATAPHDWLARALDYATREIHGAASCLTPISAGMGRISGYRSADYLHQHALQVRGNERVPDSVWCALVDHHHPEDALLIGLIADAGGRPEHAVNLYCRGIHLAPGIFRERLRELLREHGHVDESIAVLRPLVDAGSEPAALTLAHVLVDRGRVDEGLGLLRRFADAGCWEATVTLAVLLAEARRFDEAVAVLRPRSDDGDSLTPRGMIAHSLISLFANQELPHRMPAADENSLNACYREWFWSDRTPPSRRPSNDGMTCACGEPLPTY